MERQIALIRALQAGETAAADEFFSGIYNDVYYFALKTVKDADLAADVTQESLMEVFSKLNDLQDPAAFPAWCRQITYHRCTRYFRKKKDVLLESDGEDGSLFDTVVESNFALFRFRPSALKRAIAFLEDFKDRIGSDLPIVEVKKFR